MLDSELCHMYRLLNRDCARLNHERKAKIVQKSAQKGVQLTERDVNLLALEGKRKSVEATNLTTSSSEEEIVNKTPIARTTLQKLQPEATNSSSLKRRHTDVTVI